MMRTITYENMKPQTDERAGLLIIDFRVIRDSYVCFYITMLPFIHDCHWEHDSSHSKRSH